jgi:hypothetical protein
VRVLHQARHLRAILNHRKWDATLAEWWEGEGRKATNEERNDVLGCESCERDVEGPLELGQALYTVARVSLLLCIGFGTEGMVSRGLC